MWYLMMMRDGMWVYLSKANSPTFLREEAKIFNNSAEAFLAKKKNEQLFEKVKVRNSLYNL